MSHPALAGRARELHELVQGIRRLASLSVTSLAPPHVLRRCARTLAEAAAQLEDHLPPERLPRYLTADGMLDHGLADRMPFDVVIGRFNPIALPVEIRIEAPRAYGLATFTEVYEGPPGCVHGAVLAATFDMVLTAANTVADAAGPTSTLSLRYLRPTLLARPVTFEAEIRSVVGRRTTAAGRAVQDGAVTIEAEGTFAAVGRERIERMHKSAGRGAERGGGESP